MADEAPKVQEVIKKEESFTEKIVKEEVPIVGEVSSTVMSMEEEESNIAEQRLKKTDQEDEIDKVPKPLQEDLITSSDNVANREPKKKLETEKQETEGVRKRLKDEELNSVVTSPKKKNRETPIS